MGQIIMFNTPVQETTNQVIDYRDVQTARASRQVDSSLLQPATSLVTVELAGEHVAEPIKSADTIYKVSRYLISKERYRDNMLFVVGINIGLRISDLLSLRFDTIFNPDCTFKDEFLILEKKTKNTRKHKHNRRLHLNEAARDAVILYLQYRGEHGKPVSMDEYLFRSESNRSTSNKPLDPKSVDRILKGIASDLSLKEHISSHSLRKTFGYHQMAMSNNDPRKLLLLQKMFGHSTARQTLDYIGLTDEEMTDAYMELNLGSKDCYTEYKGVMGVTKVEAV